MFARFTILAAAVSGGSCDRPDTPRPRSFPRTNAAASCNTGPDAVPIPSTKAALPNAQPDVSSANLPDPNMMSSNAAPNKA
jgi:hypothetical protein